MAKRVTQLDIININKIYSQCHNKAQTARETGFSASTISKYILKNFSLEENFKREDRKEESLDLELFNNKDWNDLLILSQKEKEEMEVLRKEVYL